MIAPAKIFQWTWNFALSTARAVGMFGTVDWWDTLWGSRRIIAQIPWVENENLKVAVSTLLQGLINTTKRTGMLDFNDTPG